MEEILRQVAADVALAERQKRDKEREKSVNA